MIDLYRLIFVMSFNFIGKFTGRWDRAGRELGIKNGREMALGKPLIVILQSSIPNW